MKVLLQRVSEASVQVDAETIGSIGHGLMVLIAAGPGDQESDAKLLADKIANLRIFSDEQGKMNSPKHSDSRVLRFAISSSV